MKHLLLVRLTAGGLLGSSPGYGQVVIQHSGAADPETEGFSILTSGEAELGPVFDDQGRDAWSIQDTDRARFTSYHYNLVPAEEQAANTFGWVLSAEMRFMEAGFGRLVFMTGSEDFSFKLRLDENGNISLARRQIVLYTLEGGGTDYHEYSLVYDVLDATAALWIDGSIRLANIPGLSSPLSPAELIFGNGDRLAHTRWNEFSFTVIPEPATVALLTGLAVLLVTSGVRRRKRKVRLG